MERRAVIGTLARAGDEVRDMVRGSLREQIDDDGPQRRVEDGLLVAELGFREC